VRRKLPQRRKRFFHLSQTASGEEKIQHFNCTRNTEILLKIIEVIEHFGRGVIPDPLNYGP